MTSIAAQVLAFCRVTPTAVATTLRKLARRAFPYIFKFDSR
jgi:hypothetical protein